MSDTKERIVEETGLELADEDLEGIAGGGAHGGPVCPKCGSYEVDFNASTHTVTYCRKCGWHV